MAFQLPLIENKVTGATVGTGASVVLTNFFLWLLSQYFHAGVPVEVSSMLNLLTATAGAFIGGFVARHSGCPEEVSPSIPVTPPVAVSPFNPDLTMVLPTVKETS